MELVVLGIDQGNGNMKTASCVFPYGFKKQETKPSELFSKDILEYKGMYYSLTFYCSFLNFFCNCKRN